MRYVLIILGITIVMFNACTPDADVVGDGQLLVSWSFDGVDGVTGESNATFELINNTGQTLDADNWAVYFNQLILPSSLVDSTLGVEVKRIAGDYHSLYPVEGFLLRNGQKVAVQVRYAGFAGRVSYAPVGVYAVIDNSVVEVMDTVTWPGYDLPPLAKQMGKYAREWYDDYQSARPQSEYIVPTPRSQEFEGADLMFRKRIAIGYPNELSVEARLLEEQLKSVFTGEIALIADRTDAHIVLSFDSGLGEEEYVLQTQDGVVKISGGSEAGVFYGIRTFAQVIPHSMYETPGDQLTIGATAIRDAPRFGYRGLHLDVSRNFHTVKHLERVIDQMSLFKLNKLHLTLTNDEGWRIEIPGLPELTSVGSRRGHTSDESDRLYPAYGSGPGVDNKSGTGFYSRAEFIELLKYARTRHVEVVPELDVPGHARAAIVSMAVRSDEEFVLHDPADKSVYSSAQNYSDNVICVCRESSYRFIEKVVDEMVEMYAEADAPLTTIHCGGDEIPYGAWQQSPLCEDFIASVGEVNSTDDLHAYFMKRFIEILAKHGLTAGGWEEIVLMTDEAGHNTTNINNEFLDADVLPYVWNSVWGWGREDMAYKLANLGYEIVMCNSGDLYFDLAYNSDPREPGLTWSGYVNTKSAYGFEPFDMFATATKDKNGEPLNNQYVDSRVRLESNAEKNIIGIQGQLWSETVRNSDWLDYYLFPKLLGLAERAWAQPAGWTDFDVKGQRISARELQWRGFTANVSRHVLPLLDHWGGGVNYRISPPGGFVSDGTLRARTRYPDLEIRYTTDGSVPDTNSLLYQGPTPVEGPVRLRAFTTTGRGSRVVELSVE